MLLFNARRPAVPLWTPAATRPSSPEPRQISAESHRIWRSIRPQASQRNTNWQAYGGETTLELSYADAGADGAELRLRGDRHGGPRRTHQGLEHGATRRHYGNFWVDLTRSTLYILLPLSLLLSLLLVSQGVVQTFHSYQTATMLQPVDV